MRGHAMMTPDESRVKEIADGILGRIAGTSRRGQRAGRTSNVGWENLSSGVAFPSRNTIHPSGSHRFRMKRTIPHKSPPISELHASMYRFRRPFVFSLLLRDGEPGERCQRKSWSLTTTL
jgi:hypothetical protein